MDIDGGCLCGAVRFEAEANPRQVVICHCTDCQTHSGSAFRAVVGVRADSVRMKGELKIFEKRADSGAIRRLAFCPECGTPIYGGPAKGEDGLLNFRVGAVRQRDELRPVAQVWCRSSQEWLSGLPDLPRVETQPEK